MRFGLIGCGVVLLILVVLAFLAGDYLVGHWKEMNKKLEEIATDYRRLEKEFPFDKPANATVSPEQAARFAECRKLLLQRMERWHERMKQEDTSGFKKVTNLIFQGIPDIGKGHVEALEQVKMSPSEYFWLLNQLLLALRYAESPNAPAELKALRAEFDALSEKQTGTDTGDDAGQGKAWAYGDSNYSPRSLLPAVEASQIRIAPETIQAFLSQREALKSTFPLFLNFDGAFVNGYKEMKRKEGEAEKASSAPEDARPAKQTAPETVPAETNPKGGDEKGE